MHIPDGFLDAKTVVATAVLASIGVGTAVRRAQAHLPPRRVPLLGLTAAFVFAAQMVDVPVAGGTSGHLMGGVLPPCSSVQAGP
jgi:cobalt/nickel transport system permease protein